MRPNPMTGSSYKLREFSGLMADSEGHQPIPRRITWFTAGAAQRSETLRVSPRASHR